MLKSKYGIKKEEVLEKFLYEFLSGIGEDNLLVNDNFEVLFEKQKERSRSSNHIRIYQYHAEEKDIIFNLNLIYYCNK